MSSLRSRLQPSCAGRPTQGGRRLSLARIPRACACRQQAESKQQAEQQRRDVLLAGAGLIGSLAVSAPAQAESPTPAEQLKAGSKTLIEVKNLTTFQRADQRKAAQQRAEKGLFEGLSRDEANIALRLVLHDAATYNLESGTGGINGSIVLDEELNRPENKELRPFVEKLKGIKKKIDGQAKAAGQPTYSWADVIVLAAKVTAQKSWAAVKIAQAGLKGGETISSLYGAEFNVKLGRQDTSTADPPARIPGSDASVADIQTFMTALDNPQKVAPSGFFALLQGKPPFWEKPTFLLWTGAQLDTPAAEAKFAQAGGQYPEFKTDYDRSRKSTTRTNYEVDFITFFTQLAAVGAKFDKDAYLVPIETIAPRL